MRTLDRYLLREVLGYLVSGLFVVVLLFLGGAVYEVLAPLVAKGAEAWVVLQYLAYRVPEALVRGIPVAYLFALLLLLSRLAEDSELKALLALGVSKTRVLLPFLALGGGLALLAFTLGESWAPESLRRGQDLLRKTVLQKPRALLAPGSSFLDAEGRVVYVGQVGEELGEIRLLSPSEVVLAQRGRLEEGVLKVEKGLRITYEESRPRTVARFERGEVALSELSYEPWTNPAQGLSLKALKEEIARLRGVGLKASLEATTYHRRFAEPAASLSFALFGVGLAFFLPGSRSLGLVGVGVLTFFYYATWSVGRVLGEQGVVPPALAAWGPNLLYGLLGLLLFLWGRR
ncbi:MAG: YjgP/YjgQ family permease [Thermus sp.]|uniref:LptF/LptG family permease n=1 Tax=Thermus sp. TaxID=275 RepID=UPI003329CDDF